MNQKSRDTLVFTLPLKVTLDSGFSLVVDKMGAANE